MNAVSHALVDSPRTRLFNGSKTCATYNRIALRWACTFLKGLALKRLILAVFAFIAAPTLTVAQEGQLTVELNKLEHEEGAACRAFFLFHNDLGHTLEAFEMSLAILDSDGVIDQLLTVDAAPVPVARTTLKLFEFPGMRCDEISEILLHDIATCRLQNAEEMDCFDVLSLQSKATATLVK